MANANRHALALFAASTNAGVECHVIGNHADLGQRIRAIADQRCTLHRRADLAVFNQVSFRSAEDEFAGGDIHLPAAEIHRVKPALHTAQNFFGRMGTAQHHRVCHARHGAMRIALAATIAGGRHAHQPGILAILQEPNQDAIFNQRGAPAWRAFIIHRQAAAPIGHGAIIHHVHAGGRDALAKQAGEGGCLFAVVIAFQPMADRFMQQNAGPAGAKHHFHLSGWCGHAAKVHQRLAQRLIHAALPGFSTQHAFIGKAPAGAEAAGLPPITLGHHDRDIEAHQGAQISEALPIRAQDLHRLPFPGDGSHHLHHARVSRAGIGINFLQQGGLGSEIHLRQRIRIGVEPRIGGARRDIQSPTMALADGLYCGGGARKRSIGQFPRMGIAGCLTGHGAQAKAAGCIIACRTDAAVIQRNSLAFAVFQKQLTILTALGRVAQLAFGAGAIQQREEQFIGNAERVHGFYLEDQAFREAVARDRRKL